MAIVGSQGFSLKRSVISSRIFSALWEAMAARNGSCVVTSIEWFHMAAFRCVRVALSTDWPQYSAWMMGAAAVVEHLTSA